MDTEIEPIVDNWYFHLDKGQTFRVIAVDDDSGLVEVQHFDGDLEEITRVDWENLQIELSEEPQSWTGALDIGEMDDLGTEITDTSKDDWDESLGEFKSPGKDKLVPEA